MSDLWDERAKALENEYFHKKEMDRLDREKKEKTEQLIRELCRNRCPKCGETIEPMEFRGVPLDRCPGCHGVWLGPRDLQILSMKDHRTWFEKWFGGENE